MKVFRLFTALTIGCSVNSIAMAQTTTPAVAPVDAAAKSDPVPDATDGTSAANEIIVSGYRASLMRSSEIKRNASVIADAISAEDIGKFPDANIADALERVTGVQISQNDGGEGRFVSIRGLGSQFNVTTYNGRVLATDNAGRDFSYDVLPAESLGSATVFKTSEAVAVDGSIGGGVELTTLNPLARKGFHINGNAGALYDDSTRRVQPRLGIAVSDTFADDTVGVMLGSYIYKRQWRSDTFENLGSVSTEYVVANGTSATACSPYWGYSTPCTSNGKAAYPGIVSYQVKNGPRDRFSLVGAIEWRPNERLHSKIDAFYTYYNDPENNYSYNINFYENNGWARFSNATVAPWPGPNNDNYVLKQFSLTNIGYELGTDTQSRTVRTWEVGWNTEYQATDRLKATLDVAYSSANRPNTGQNYYTVAGIAGADYTYTLTNAAPTVQCTLESTGQSCFNATNNQIGLHYMQQTGESTRDSAFSSKLDFDWRAGTVASLDTHLLFGGFFSNRAKAKDEYASPNGCAYCNNFTQTLGAVGINAIVPFPFGNGFQAGQIGNNNTWQALSATQLFAAAVAYSGQAYFDANIKAAYLPRASSYVNEDIYGGYAELKAHSDRIDANLGVRYVRTHDLSEGATQQLLTLTPIANSTNYIATYSGVVPVSATNTYDNWLPSANLTYHFNRRLQLRLAASEAVTRPSFSQLGLDVDYEVNSPPPRVSQNGNPALHAITADSLDASLEWYAGHGTSLSVAGFYKNVNGFITTGTFPTTIAGQAGQITEPINGDSAKLGGVEAAVQYIHPKGFGFSANYTFVANTASFTLPDGSKVTRGLDGVSQNTYNVSVFYDKKPFSVRLSYAYRGKYVDCALCGPDSTPSTTAGMGSLDLSTSVEIRKGVSLYFNGTNLTGSVYRRYVYDPSYLLFYEKYSRRYEFGIRGSF